MPANVLQVLKTLAWTRRENAVAFYAESHADWAFFEDVIRCLEDKYCFCISYFSSDRSDPILLRRSEQFHACYVGSGALRTWLFQVIDAKVVVMTLTDLGKFHLKRSGYPVHYIYLFHSLNSTHMSYRRGAFDEYDSLLCVGPHQVEELHAMRRLYSAPTGQVVACGYPRLDKIAREICLPNELGGIVVAPTWGSSSFIEATLGLDIMDTILSLKRPTSLRLHPMTRRHYPDLCRMLQTRFRSLSNFQIESDITSVRSLIRASILVTDWSGAALEYALGNQRPAILIGMPPKVNNPRYEELACEPLEMRFRNQLGRKVEPSDFDRLATLLTQTTTDRERLNHRLFRDQWVYNVGTSAQVAADHIWAVMDGRASSC